jgi:hypothetical protein
MRQSFNVDEKALSAFASKIEGAISDASREDEGV